MVFNHLWIVTRVFEIRSILIASYKECSAFIYKPNQASTKSVTGLLMAKADDLEERV